LGLGLPIARQILEQMGSRFELSSEVGAGSRFTFCLPIAIVDEPPVLPREELTDLPLGYEGRSRRLLVLDDHEPSRQFLLELLGDLGFEVLAFASGRQALEHLQAAAAQGEWPDAMLVDQYLQFEETGWAFLESVSRLQSPASEAQHTPVIMISAAPPEPVRYPALQLHPSPEVHLLKPVEPQQLLLALQKLLALHWRYASDSLPLPSPDDSPATVSTLDQRPRQADWQSLLQAAQSASLSDLEDWLARFGQHAPELDGLLDQLDFSGIGQLAQKRLAA
jgi:CheY-like chemotaxis protein